MVQFILLKPLESNFLLFLEEVWTGECVECKVPRELLLYTDQLMPPIEIGENWMWEVWGAVVYYNIVECSTVQCSAAVVQFILLKPLKSNFLQFLEGAWTGQCVECKVPRELLLHTDQLMPPLEIGENLIWEVGGEKNAIIQEEQ